MKSKFDPQKHHRRSIRLKNYDYSWAGAYYVTIVTWHREILFGEVVNGEMILNQAGKIVQAEWLEFAKRLKYVELDAFIVMPNHFHGILHILETAGATHQFFTKTLARKALLQNIAEDSLHGSPLPSRGAKPASLGALIGQFKSRATKQLWKTPELRSTPIWQRNYYEHIIRDEQDLKNKTDYIEANPLLWDEDDENPINIKS